MIPIELRKKLVLALLSAERLYLVFEKASYFDPTATQAFLDAMWATVSDGTWPPKSVVQKVRKFIGSSAIPDEEDCAGTDFDGLSFVSCLDILSDPAAREDDGSLAYLSGEIEFNLLDHYLHELYSTGYSLQDDSLEAKITSDARMLRLEKQVANDKVSVATMNLDLTSLEHLKRQAIFDILS